MSEKRPETYYESSWDAYYKSMMSSPEVIPWDVDPVYACQKDWAIMAPHFDQHIALMDIGCGIGTQSAFFAEYFDRVIGTDISVEAIQIANQKFGHLPGVDFDTLDVTHPDNCKIFHEKNGDCNLYMRGTLQQILSIDRLDFARSISILMGTTGRFYFIELSTTAKSFFIQLHKERGGLPETLKRVLSQKVTQLIGVHEEDIPKIFPDSDFNIITSGQGVVALKVSATEHVGVPATYAIIENRKN